MTASSTNDTGNLPAFPPVRPASCPFDPPAEFAEWREEEGLRRVLWKGIPVWAVNRYEDIKAALTDPRISADTLGKLLPGFPGQEALPIFPRMDDPEHTRIRRMLTKDFTVKRIASMKPQIQDLVDTFLDQMISKGAPADLLTELLLNPITGCAGELRLQSICRHPVTYRKQKEENRAVNAAELLWAVCGF